MKLTRLNEENEGVSFEKAQEAWKASGGPRTPQELVDFVTKTYGFNEPMVNNIFKKAAGLTLMKAKDTDTAESLTPQSIERLERVISTMNIGQLKDFEQKVNDTKIMSKRELEQS